MTLYIERLHSDALARFCSRRDLQTKSQADDALIAFARRGDVVGLLERGRWVAEEFGREHVGDVEDVLDQIIADLDRQEAELSPETEPDAPAARIRVIVAEIEGASVEEAERFARMVGEIVGGRG